MNKQLKAVEEFHKKFLQPVNSKPIANIPLERKVLRYELMKEENEEYREAVQNNDLVEIADALGDMLYILCGTIIEHGLQHKIEEVFDEIQRSNMSKLGENGKPVYREDGKVIKGPNYSKPNISKILEEKSKKLILIAALSGNEVIAKDGKIPWHLPNDFKRFKEVTSGHHIIIGRKTFESLPGILPNRTHVVITRSKDYINIMGSGTKDSPIIVVNSLEEAIKVCPNNETSYIIGGGEIYEQAIPVVDELDLTIVDLEVTGDNLTKFPSAMAHMGKFKIISKIDHKIDEKHKHSFSFMRLIRR